MYYILCNKKKKLYKIAAANAYKIYNPQPLTKNKRTIVYSSYRF